MNNEEFEDIEQLLKPQCEFKASDALTFWKISNHLTNLDVFKN